VEDDIQTWQVSEIDKKGKKKKGKLGIGGGTIFFASEADKVSLLSNGDKPYPHITHVIQTPVQKWQTKDIAIVVAEKSKHVFIDIEGPSPISLHFHAGSKENADAIVTKLQSSKALSSAPQESRARDLSPPPAADPSGMKKPSVHFSPASPVIIPSAPEEEQAEEGEEEEQHILEQIDDDSYKLQPASVIMEAVALYDFGADGVDELSVAEGERLTVLEKDGDEWWKCRNSKGLEGVVPASYLEVCSTLCQVKIRLSLPNLRP
jgi:actin cytoskeleton-regulatory complex protein SLA1